MKLRIAFDFDGTVTRYPHLFKEMVESYVYQHHNVFIVTGTKDESLVRRKLNEWGFPQMGILVLPEDKEYSDVPKFKKNFCTREKIDLMYENNQYTAEIIREVCPVFLVR